MIRSYLEGKDPETLSVKKVRKYLEESLGLAEDALKPQKEVLGGMIDKVLAELAA